jgi:hypothetical protein
LANEKDILRSAETLIRAHGKSAAMICAENVAKWKARGDAKAAQLWADIMEAVRNLDI